MPIKNHLRALRMRRGKTQAQVVEEITRQQGRCPFIRSSLSHYELGRGQVPATSLDALCQYYDKEPGDILFWVPAAGARARKLAGKREPETAAA